jgi:hypothetical protein
MADEAVVVPTLMMTGGPLDGTAYPIPMLSEVVIGSSMDAGLQIMLGNVEPFHAKLMFSGSGMAIADAGSATGTFVNGERVEGEQPLRAGDRICLGPPGAKASAKLLVLLPSAGATPPPARGASPSLQDAHPAPSFGGEAPALSFGDDQGTSPHFNIGEPEVSYAAEPLGEDEPLFAAPLPPRAAREPEQPPSAEPPPARAAAPPPPPPPPPAPPAPPAAARAAASEPVRPDYNTELPSIPVEREPQSREFPTLRPSARPGSRPPAAGRAKGKPRARRRSVSLPIVPLAAGVAGLAVVARSSGSSSCARRRPSSRV